MLQSVGKLEDEIKSLKEALAAEQDKTYQYERGSCPVQAELAVQLAVSQSHEKTLEQVGPGHRWFLAPLHAL